MPSSPLLDGHVQQLTEYPFVLPQSLNRAEHALFYIGRAFRPLKNPFAGVGMVRDQAALKRRCCGMAWMMWFINWSRL